MKRTGYEIIGTVTAISEWESFYCTYDKDDPCQTTYFRTETEQDEPMGEHIRYNGTGV